MKKILIISIFAFLFFTLADSTGASHMGSSSGINWNYNNNYSNYNYTPYVTGYDYTGINNYDSYVMPYNMPYSGHRMHHAYYNYTGADTNYYNYNYNYYYSNGYNYPYNNTAYNYTTGYYDPGYYSNNGENFGYNWNQYSYGNSNKWYWDPIHNYYVNY